MQLYVSLKINLDIPFLNTIKACKIFQPIFPVALSFIKDSVVVSQKTNKKTLQVYAIKCIHRKTEVRRVQTESVLGPVGMFTCKRKGKFSTWQKEESPNFEKAMGAFS